MTQRAMASVQRILSVAPVPNSDALDVVQIRGWQVVTRRGEFYHGNIVVYLEIDSWVPHELAPFLSRGNPPREYEGKLGERLRTVKLRGQISQGLVLPLSVLMERAPHDAIVAGFTEGQDVSEILGVIKYEPPVHASLRGAPMGNFPSFLRKTDQERIQNSWNDVECLTSATSLWEVQEKLDGSSCTIFFHEGKVGVCSRNLELKLDVEGNAYVDRARNEGYLAALEKVGQSIAVQAELCGPGIQGNKYKLPHPRLFVFDVWLIEQQRYATKAEREEILLALHNAGADVTTVPEVDIRTLPDTLEECLALADGKSHVCPTTNREGLVWKSLKLEVDGTRNVSFKVISNKFLLANDD